MNPVPEEDYFSDNNKMPVVLFSENIADSIKKDIGEELWKEAYDSVLLEYGYTDVGKRKRKNQMIIATTMNKLWQKDVKSNKLLQVCERILL